MQANNDSFFTFPIRNNFLFSPIEEAYRKTEEFNKIIEEIIEEDKKKEEEAKNEKEDLRQKNQSQMYNKDYFHHPNKNHPEKNPFYFSKISLDKEFPSFSKKKTNLENKFLEISIILSKKIIYFRMIIKNYIKKKQKYFLMPKRYQKKKQKKKILKIFQG